MLCLAVRTVCKDHGTVAELVCALFTLHTELRSATEPGSPGSTAEDPAPLEAELRRREAALGPGHPAVAEAASTLAILHNQVRRQSMPALPGSMHAVCSGSDFTLPYLLRCLAAIGSQ